MAARHLENRKNRDIPATVSRNLTRRCSMGLLTAVAVEKFESYNPKMAEGRH